MQNKIRKIEKVKKKTDKNTAGRRILEQEQKRQKERQRKKRREFHACPRELLSGSSRTGSLLPSKAAPYCTEISTEEVCMCECAHVVRSCVSSVCMYE